MNPNNLIKNKVLRFLIICLSVGSLSCTDSDNQDSRANGQIERLKDLPVEAGFEKSLGYAGMMGGMHNGILIAAGGANFPEGTPWEGGKKKWSRAIFLFEDGEWRISNTSLPMPLAYGAHVQTEKGIVVMGGNNEDTTSSSVFLLSYNKENEDIEITDLPALPRPLAYMPTVRVENKIYVIGGADTERSCNSVYRLDLNTDNEWQQLEDFPGTPRSFHSAAVQETSTGKKIFVFGGRNPKKGGTSDLLDNYITYDLKNEKWEAPRKIAIDGQARVVMGASAIAQGSMHILLYGGDDGKLFSELGQLDLEINRQKADSAKSLLIARKKELLTTHPGFGNKILGLNTITNSWFVYKEAHEPFPVTALSFQDGNSYYLISGEVSPGIRTSQSQKITNAKAANTFGFLNYVTVALYLLITLFIGLYFSKKQRSTADYFTGGGRVPWWASGISVFGTLLSALTFMAVPAKSFLTDWSYFFVNMTAIIIVPVIVFLFIPYFHRLNITTAYQFLENRFNYLARALGSLSFILFQVGRIAIVLLLPSLAISIVTGIPVETSILIMGILCVIYTTFGGIEAVIWTDVLQVIVLLGGSILAIFWLLQQSEVSVPEAYAFALEKNKFNLANLELNFNKSTFWVVCLGGLASALITQGTDQTVVQRYLTSSSVKDARKTSYVNAALTLPATIIFFGIGTLLFIFYSKMPERLPPNLSNNDSIFPWYIVNELPAGISGLLIAAIFSAAMSSISSSLNSVSTAFCNDFYKHFKPNTSDLRLLKIARITTIIIGLGGVLIALWMAKSDIKSLWDQFLKFIGLLTAGLGGMFLLGIVTKKANAPGTLIGVVLSTLLLLYISLYTDIHILMYSFIGLTTCFISGYIFSLLLNNK